MLKTVSAIRNYTSLNAAITSKTFADTGYTASINDFCILVNATGGATIINLPAAATVSGYIYVVKKTDSSVNTVTIDANASETIDGALTRVLSYQYASVTIQSNGSSWFVIGEVLSSALLIE